MNPRDSSTDDGSAAIQPPETKRKLETTDKPRKKIRAEPQPRGLAESCLRETEYYFDRYMRKVYPYHFTYATFCKGRWVGRRLLDVFSEEFHAHSAEEYEKNIRAGNIRINDLEISPDYVFRDNDKVTNVSHRHETAVAAAPIRLIHSCEDFVVVDKPPSIPVHPCGRYRHNCLLFILAEEHGLRELYCVHRLDRLTSGVLMLTKTIRKSQEVNEQIRERKVTKEYVCRVSGEFPDGIVRCEEPIETVSPKMGVCMVSLSGKTCETSFEKLSFNGKSSVVRCMPKTGRMHQIRVHLQYLGYPILYDPIYNHETAFGPNKGKNGDTGKTKEQLLEDLLNTHNLDKWLLDETAPANSNGTTEQLYDDFDNRVALSVLDFYTKADGFQDLAAKYRKNETKLVTDSKCDLCHKKYMDPQPKDMVMFLHALKYEGADWKFESELPVWAKPDWDEC